MTDTTEKNADSKNETLDPCISILVSRLGMGKNQAKAIVSKLDDETRAAIAKGDFSQLPATTQKKKPKPKK